MAGHDRMVWISGELLKASDASINAFDHSITVGDGVFEAIEAQDGVPFALKRHLARMRRSAEAMHIRPGLSDEQITDAVEQVLAHSPTDRLIRLTVTAGPGPLGSGRGDGPATVIVATTPGPSWPQTTDVITVEWARNDQGALTGVKSTSYAENVLALRRALEAGATEAIFPNTRGNLCEGTGSNIFIELDGHLVTPPLSAGCLAGITRELILELAEVEERDVPMSALHSAQEAFISSTSRDVLAIGHVDGQPLSHGPGPLTSRVAAAFAELKATTSEP